MSRPSIILIAAAFILIPAGILLEDQGQNIWENRLFAPEVADEPNLHTPRFLQGTYLPPTITTTTTLTPRDNPIILTGTTHVPANVTLTLEPGVMVVAHEFATLTIAGTLNVRGTTSEPVIFTTNEAHPLNQNWNGLTIEKGGRVLLDHTRLTHASPALTCEATSTATATNIQIENAVVGIYTESAQCRVSHSRIQAIQYGVVARGTEASVTDTTISAGKQELLTTN